MNIRLDKDVRIRIDKEDVVRLQDANRLAQNFKIGVFNFNLQIDLDSSALTSRVDYTPSGVSIYLGTEDTLRLISDSGTNDCVSIDDIKIQVDRWSHEKRSRHESLKKDSQDI